MSKGKGHLLSKLQGNKYVQFFLPLVWPKENLGLQISVALSLLTVFVGLGVNIQVPILTQDFVDKLSSEPRKSSSTVFSSLLTLLLFKAVQGVGTLSILNVIHSLLWIKQEQFIRKSVQVAFFCRLHSMSVRWAASQKTGDLLGALERGTAAAAAIIERLVYTAFPTVADILLAVTYLSLKFNALVGLVILLQVGAYMFTTVSYTEWRTRFQRKVHLQEDATRQVAMESLLNFETVKLFDNEAFEVQKYAKVIDSYHAVEGQLLSSLSVLQLLQLVVVNVGLGIVSFLVVASILVQKDLVVGDYVLLSAYMAQLIIPLNYFGMHYRCLRIEFVSLNHLMDILATDKKEKSPRNVIGVSKDTQEGVQGGIEFRNVTFSHDGRRVLEGLDLKIGANETVAIVGSSGEGKSTLMRLLTRLYDVDEGQVLIDGVDIRELSTNYLRSLIGVVPQDTVLFHDTLMNNIRYAKLDAEDHQVVLAGQAGKIHESVVARLPEKYETLVGERGLKFSGGEKQRVLLSRIFLKDPPIVILDEATSSLDVKTEADIMASCTTYFRAKKTKICIVITHRLQNVVHLDKICVLKGGVIVEKGSHETLLGLKGEYYSMWEQQQQTQSTMDVNVGAR